MLIYIFLIVFLALVPKGGNSEEHEISTETKIKPWMRFIRKRNVGSEHETDSNLSEEMDRVDPHAFIRNSRFFALPPKRFFSLDKRFFSLPHSKRGDEEMLERMERGRAHRPHRRSTEGEGDHMNQDSYFRERIHPEGGLHYYL